MLLSLFACGKKRLRRLQVVTHFLELASNFHYCTKAGKGKYIHFTVARPTCPNIEAD